MQLIGIAVYYMCMWNCFLHTVLHVYVNLLPICTMVLELSGTCALTIEVLGEDSLHKWQQMDPEENTLTIYYETQVHLSKQLVHALCSNVTCKQDFYSLVWSQWIHQPHHDQLHVHCRICHYSPYKLHVHNVLGIQQCHYSITPQ